MRSTFVTGTKGLAAQVGTPQFMSPDFKSANVLIKHVTDESGAVIGYRPRIADFGMESIGQGRRDAERGRVHAAGAGGGHRAGHVNDQQI